MIDSELLLSKLSQNLLEVLDDDEYYDITIEAGNDPYVKIFRAHMVILYYRSPHLRRILSTNKKKDDGTLVHIKLPNILPEIFQAILRYIYGGNISLKEYDTSDIIKILVAARELGLHELIIHLQYFLIENGPNWMELNFNLVYKVCLENNSFTQLEKYCNDLISKDPDKILKSIDLSSTSERLLNTLIQDKNLQMSKIQIWEYVLKWGRAQNPELPSDPTNYSREDFNTLKNSLQQIIPFIGFYNITSEEFSDKVLPYKKILPKELYKDLLKYFLKPNNQKSGPCGEETERSSGRNFLEKDIRILDPLASDSLSHLFSNLNGDSSNILKSSTQFKYSYFLPKSIHLLALIITFEYHRLGRPNLDTCHSKGYHPITRHFGDLGIDGNNAFQFVYDSIMNCWANSWKIALVVSIDPMKNVRELHNFLEEIRKKFGGEILDIIFVQPVQPSNPTGYLSNLDVYVVKNDKLTWKQEFDNVMDKIITKAYSRNKYGGDEILFYNEDEPYHEFSNFYKAQITMGYEEWPTIEHYFQAAKFRDRYLHNKIRLARLAREAFIIAQKNDYKKRKDWESPTLPDNKESIMRNALFQKFMQHEKLKYKLLSTGKVKIFNHTENDRYWGDGGGRNHDGLNRLGIMLQEIREIIMEEEKSNLINKYNSNSFIKWVVPELGELRQFDNLNDFIDFGNFKI